jgi:hypothetical protein
VKKLFLPCALQRSYNTRHRITSNRSLAIGAMPSRNTMRILASPCFDTRFAMPFVALFLMPKCRSRAVLRARDVSAHRFCCAPLLRRFFTASAAANFTGIVVRIGFDRLGDRASRQTLTNRSSILFIVVQ